MILKVNYNFRNVNMYFAEFSAYIKYYINRFEGQLYSMKAVLK